jgi:hypothetical protein
MTTRVFRGGGFTKDYLYLRGFRDILRYFAQHGQFDELLIGKTSLQYAGTLREMIERKLLLPPKHKTQAFVNPSNNDVTLNYVVAGIG